MLLKKMMPALRNPLIYVNRPACPWRIVQAAVRRYDPGLRRRDAAGKWRLLGPMTALNGVLMIGWSTALIFEVLITPIRRSTSAPGRSGRL
jgi:hypothetical protein